MSSVLTSLYGTTQGRIQPVNSTPVLEDNVFCLGSDVPGVLAQFKLGDGLLLEQTADVTGIVLIRFRAKITARDSAIVGALDLDEPSVDHSSVYATIDPFFNDAATWQFSWGVNATTHGYRNLRSGQTLDLRDGTIDVSQLTGNQALRFRLKLVQV